MSRTIGTRTAGALNQDLALAHNGAAVAYELTIATEQRALEAQTVINDAASMDGQMLSLVRVVKSGKNHDGMPDYVIFGVVNTLETFDEFAARLRPLLFERANMHAGEQWKSIGFRCRNLPPEYAAPRWAEWWASIKDEVHRTQDDGSVLVMPRGDDEP